MVLIGWSSWFVYQTSFVLNGTRYFSLFDDAMISSSFAMNLVEGKGLVWDGATDPVEGFTNPLWTLAMTLSHLPCIPIRYRSLVVQALSLALLVTALFLVRRLMTSHFGAREGRLATWLPACVLTATYYPLTYWSLMGMETGLQACLAVLGSHLALDESEKDGPTRIIPLAFVLSLAYLTRMDMSPWIVFVIGYVIWRRPSIAATRAFCLGMGILGIAIIGYQAFRVGYFGDPLPNTYYLKMSGIPLGLRLSRGLLVTLRGLGLALLPMLLMTVAARVWRRRRPGLVLVVGPIWIVAAYSVWVGGDAWEGAGIGANRFLVWSMPLLFIGLNGACNLLSTRDSGWSRPAAAAMVTVVLGVAFLIVPGTSTVERISDLLVLRSPYHVEEHARILEEYLELQRAFPEDLSVTTVYAGIPAVYTDFRLVDFLGYTDAWLSKRPPAVPLDEPRLYEPGHVKWDLNYVLDVRRPDIVMHTFGIPRKQAVPELLERGYREYRGLWLAPWIDRPSLRREGREPPPRERDRTRHEDSSPTSSRPNSFPSIDLLARAGRPWCVRAASSCEKYSRSLDANGGHLVLPLLR